MCRRRRAPWIYGLLGLFALFSLTMNAAPDPDPGAKAANRLDEKVKKISTGRTFAEVRAEIAAWKAREPESAEPYAVSASYELRLSRQPMANYGFTTNGIPRRPPVEGTEYSIRDPKTGKEVAVLGERPIGPKPDAATVKKQQEAVATELAAGLAKFPDRLDFMINRSIVLAALGDWPAVGAQMESALRRAATDPEKLRWLEDQRPPYPLDAYLRDVLQGFINKFLQKDDASNSARARDFSEIGLKYYPRDVRMLTNMGSSYILDNRWDLALPYFEAARRSVPDDDNALFNLGQAYCHLGREKEARPLFEQVIRQARDPQLEAVSREFLKLVNEHASQTAPN